MNRMSRIAAVIALTAAGVAHALPINTTIIVAPVKPALPIDASPSLPTLKICFTKVFVSPTESRTFARACSSFEAPGTVRLG